MTDCLVIGGGAIGLSLAYDLATCGMQVRVLDREEPGRQTSWAGAGILPPANWDTARDAYDKLCGLSCQLHPRWAEALREETGIDTGYRRCGGIYVARGTGEASSLAAVMRQLAEDQIRVQQLDAKTLRDREPALRPTESGGHVQAAYWLPEEAQLRNPRYLKALVKACMGRGVEINGHTAIERFQFEGSRVTAVASATERLHADHYCVTTGAWTRQLLSEMGLRVAIRPWRGQMALLSGPPSLIRSVVNEGPRYLVPRDDGRVLAGSTVEDAGFDNRTTTDAIAELVRFAVSLVPALGEAHLETSWAGLRPRTGDGLPFLGAAPGIDNLWVAAGHFRSGIQLAPATAVVMSQLIRGQTPSVDPWPFRLDRE